MDVSTASATSPIAPAAAEPATAATGTVAADPAAATEPRTGIAASLANAISDRAQILEANRSLTGTVGELRQSLAAAEQRASAAEAALATFRAETEAATSRLQADHAAELARIQGEAAKVTDSIPEKVATATIDTVAQLGIPEADLPAAGTGGDAKNAGEPLTMAERERVLTEKAAALVPALGLKLGLN